MAKNFIQLGDVLTIPAPANTLSGEVVVIGELVGIAQGNAAEGAPLDIRTEGVFELPKVAANAISVGEPLFYVAASKLVTDDDNEGANARVGVAVAAAGATTATVRVKL
ncbi:DUF2190 family protein [Agrobacterium pusense]|uniref:DUF2190 family protein n=1 Tax=Agrobacterium pusense TaxID=648995 RepID=UPI000D1A4556|nr:DUF2190 family protein [Agrobacterium pusense]